LSATAHTVSIRFGYCKKIYGSYTLECAAGRESSVFLKLEKVKKKLKNLKKIGKKVGKKLKKVEKKLEKSWIFFKVGKKVEKSEAYSKYYIIAYCDRQMNAC
jgi:hypothetical protein